MPEIDREGTFQIEVTEYGLREAKESQAVSLVVKAKITAQWNPATQAWDDWTQYETYTASGDLNLVKKDGGLNEGQAKSLVEAIGWEGDFVSLAEQKLTMPPCQATIKPDVYKGVTRYRIDWLNAHDRVPGGLSNLDESKSKALNQRLGGAVRALVGNVKRNAAPAAGSVPPSPKKPSTRQPAAVAANGSEDVPF